MKKPNRTYADRKLAAFNAGLAAFKQGKRLTDCPVQKHQGLKRAWSEGWLAGETERDKQTSGMFIAKAAPAPKPTPVAAPIQQALAHG